jgi:hypothetical protein
MCLNDVIKRQILYRGVAPGPLDRKVCDRLRSARRVEVVEVLVVGRKERRNVFTGGAYSQPGSFDLRHVPDQSQQRERRGRHRSQRELLGI